MPLKLKNKIEQKAKVHNFKVNPIVVNRTPFKFNVKLLMLSADISTNGIMKILKAINLNENKVFLIDSTKNNSRTAKTEIRKDYKLSKKLAYFEQRDFHKAYDFIESENETSNGTDEIILTYAGSAICKAVDMPERNLVIVECSLFVPTIALNFDKNITEDEKRQLLIDEIRDKITQIIGRVFRSKQKPHPTETLVDERSIVIVLYNLPYELQEFKPDEKLLNSFESYKNEHISGKIKNKRINNIVTSILEALSGKEVSNKSLLQRKEVVKKVKKLGLTSLDRRTEREILEEEDLYEIGLWGKEENNKDQEESI